MRIFGNVFIWLCSLYATSSVAVENNTQANVGDSLGRLVLGTLLVLLVIGGLAWLARKWMPGQTGSHLGVIKQVGGLQLSPRERVVVLEVGGRWLVVGCHAGQMTALGEMAAQLCPADTSKTNTISASQGQESQNPLAVDANASFSKRLQQAMQHTLKQTFK